MGKVANAAVAARARAQERMAALHAERAARDQRIEDAAADVFAELDAKTAAAARRALAVEAAQRAIADAEQAEREAVAAADARIGTGVAALKGEGLTVAQIAELVTLPAADVRRLLRGPAAPAAPVESGGDLDGAA
ncbi:hypothetical protein [Nakamurella endophytica]|uniref:Uncharacterized protein n=1 Tax=Nakamurella endophytica TaxID=1748367 RepID=A0A917WJY6_9ACTN|nr:hypothetical protein [Nakamurella endophytica]GGM09540.1 hypothetical protein GCM10011594_31780 [Nakamurella endophytica]